MTVRDIRTMAPLDRRTFFAAGAGASLIAASTSFAAPLHKGHSPDWRDESWTNRYPQLSLKERDRRLELARKLMVAEGLDCLVIASPTQSHDFVGHYFSNEATPTVIIPKDGEPIAFQDNVSSPTAKRDFELAQALYPERWIKDWRFNEGAPGIAAALSEMGLGKARVGCTGLTALWPVSPYMVNGGAPWNKLPLTHSLMTLLPQFEWVDVWSSLLPAIAVKSGEELEQYKKAAHLAERATQLFFDNLRVGGTEADAMAHAAYDIFRHGAWTPSGGSPYISTRPLAESDVVTNEIIVYVGATEAQAGWTSCMGQPGVTMTKLIDAAHMSYELGLRAVRPGLALRELQEIMSPPFRKLNAWNNAPLFHGLSPIFTNGQTSRFVEQGIPSLRQRYFSKHDGELPYSPTFGADIKLQPGMAIHLEPNGQIGRDKVFLGANLLVTADGAEEYSASSRRVHMQTA